MKKNSRKIFSFMLALAIMMTSFAIPSNAETVKAETISASVNWSDYDTYADAIEALGKGMKGQKVAPSDFTQFTAGFDENGNMTYMTYSSLLTDYGYVIPSDCVQILVDAGCTPYVGYYSNGTKFVIVKTDGYNIFGFNADGYDRNGNYFKGNNSNNNSNNDKGIKINKATFGDLASILSKKKYDENRDGYLSDDEIFFLDELDVKEKISNVKGLELLTGCSSFTFWNYVGKTININSKNIKEVEIHSKTALTVNAPYAKEVTAEGTKVTINAPNAVVVYGRTTESLNLKKCKSARGIAAHLGKNNKKLILPENKKKLEIFSCTGVMYKNHTPQANISTLNLSKYENLKILTFYHCGVKKLNVTGCKKLSYFYMYDCNKIKTVDFSKNKKFIAGDFYGCKALKTIKNPPKGKVTRGKGMSWLDSKKYYKFLKDNNLTDGYLNELV